MKYNKDMLYAQADQQKKQYIMQIDQQVRSQESTLQQQFSQQMISIQQQAAQQKAALEQQAMQLTLEYQQKSSEEEMRGKLFDMQKQQYEAQVKMAEQVRQLQHGAAVSSPAISESTPQEPIPSASQTPFEAPAMAIPHSQFTMP